MNTNQVKPEQMVDDAVNALADKLHVYFRGYSDAALKMIASEFIAAAINAWPGMRPYHFPDNGGWFPAIILPLTQEASDD